MKKILLTLGIISALSLTACDTFDKNTPKPSSEPSDPIVVVVPEDDTPTEPEAPQQEPIESETVSPEVPSDETPIIKEDSLDVTAKQLARDYSIDEYRSDTLYKDKDLIVTGEVDSIFISASSDKAIVFLKTENKEVPVLASGEAAFATRVKDLKILENVKLSCTGMSAVTKAPQVNNCNVL